MRAGMTITTAAALVTGLVWWGTADLVSGDDPDNAATALVPVDGTRLVDTDDDGTVRVAEEARLGGAEMVTTSPPLVGGALATILDGDPYGWKIWRTTLTSYDIADGASGEQSTTLRRLTDRGVEQIADYGPFTLVFDPPLLELPADVHDGSTWSSAGDATTDGGITYTSQLKAASAEPEGCLRVTGETVFTEAGSELLTSPADDTWCPGQGIVADAGADHVEVPTYAGATAPQVPLAVGAEDWEVHERPTVVAESVEDAADTGGRASLIVDLAPAGNAADGLTVANAQGRDVIGLTSAGNSLVRAWVGHPGGTILSLATSGTVTVAGTSRRRVVAYGDHGQWLWTHDLDEAPLTTPLTVDEDHLVVTTVGGEVVALDPATGRAAWQAQVDGAVREVPVTDGETVVVADDTGGLRALGVDDGDERWSTGLEAPVTAMAVVGSTLVTYGAGVVRAFALDDGTPIWSTPYDGVGGYAVAELGRTVAVASGDETVGYAVADGHELWRHDGAATSLGLDSRLVQVDDHQMTVRDDAGDLLGSWALTRLRGTTDFVSPADAGVWVMDAGGDLVEVGP